VLQRALIGAHTPSAAAAGYGTAFWWATGITVLAIIPCVVLMRAERAARLTADTVAEPDTETLSEAVLA
jgi:hypothetical protein